MLNIKQLIPSGFCLKCDGCCRFAEENSVWFPRLLKEEEKAIPKDKFHPVPNKKENNFLCAFLRAEDNKCKIYESRPFECRLYPFLLAREAKSGKIFLAVDRNCPFAQQNVKSKKLEKYTEYLTAFLKGKDFLMILRDNAGLIQSYPGALNIIELPYEITQIIPKR